MKILTLCLLSLIALACADQEANQNSRQETNETTLAEFNTYKIKIENIRSVVNITGRVYPIQKVDITSEVQGKSMNLRSSFKEGVSYKKGELMIAIEDEKFKKQLSAQKSRFLGSLIRIMSDIKIDFPNEYDSWSNYLSMIDFDHKLPDMPVVNDTKLRYYLVANNIFTQYYEIKSQEEVLQDYKIHAPFNGALTMSIVEPGDLIRPGIKIGEFIRTDFYEVKTAIPVGDINSIEIGQSVNLECIATQNNYDATITRIGKSIDKKTQSISVFMKVTGIDLKEGLYLEGQLATKEFRNAIQISKDLLTKENQIYVIQDSVVRLKNVSILDVSDTRAVITGLSENDNIIVDPIYNSIDGIRAIPKSK
ncbi:MAG: HlyD family efflux transporter periplasmic adaptor subunit [bacterium]|nr:HlyD family efflux transporter periplasmic adaptor subunit [bacterium]